jgi:hypothetical protein
MKKKAPHSLCWIMTTLSALAYLEVPVLGLLPLERKWVLKTWQILLGLLLAYTTKICKSQGI